MEEAKANAKLTGFVTASQVLFLQKCGMPGRDRVNCFLAHMKRPLVGDFIPRHSMLRRTRATGSVWIINFLV